MLRKSFKFPEEVLKREQPQRPPWLLNLCWEVLPSINTQNSACEKVRFEHADRSYPILTIRSQVQIRGLQINNGWNVNSGAKIIKSTTQLTSLLSDSFCLNGEIIGFTTVEFVANLLYCFALDCTGVDDILCIPCSSPWHYRAGEKKTQGCIHTKTWRIMVCCLAL